ncbi:MAG TPA: TetR/AcrR family transcriptional regulator [Terriglobales bacterium]|nr:TetR/AcrR family transcriptional regulator [Terriglobales bacterium]
MRTALERAREAPQSTKARILATAEEVFALRGFAGASTREIAAKAGVNISSLHYHWASKETLYLAVFQDIYERIVAAVREVVPAAQATADSRAAVEAAMATLFDFFADRPSMAKLLVRRLLEDEEGPADIEREVLVPAWQQFAEWLRGGAPAAAIDAPLFMLTIHNVLMLFLLDSRHYASLLGGSVHQPEVRARVRRYIIDLVPLLLGGGKSPLANP